MVNLVEKVFELPREKDLAKTVFKFRSDDYESHGYLYGVYINEEKPLPVIAYMTS